jgi:UPF0042 nucleotide-binding protein
VAEREFVILTGMSGAGKSLAMKCFEDLGYFCVDNLPPALIPKFVQLCGASKVERLALVIDIRGREFFHELHQALDSLPSAGFLPAILFLEASDEVLVRRYAQTRRLHPLESDGRIMQAIRQERQLLADMRRLADRVLDTSNLSPHQLMAEIARHFGPRDRQWRVALHLVSFGYKYGLPRDADMVIDVRFLPNPFYIKELRPLSGLDERVRQYVHGLSETGEFLQRLYDLLDFLLPRYLEGDKKSLTLAVGCTGGRHRSIVLAETIADRYRAAGYPCSVEHRDLAKDEVAAS